MRRLSESAVVVFCVLSATGCAINDPNRNSKVRYVMVRQHASRALKEAGYEVRPYWPDYEAMQFDRFYYDKAGDSYHNWELTDFLKITDKPGPDRFVIVYERETRKTYLRSNLRSNENLERLPVTGTGPSSRPLPD